MTLCTLIILDYSQIWKILDIDLTMYFWLHKVSQKKLHALKYDR